MLKMNKVVVYTTMFFLLYLTQSVEILSQSFGFGCLGLSGVFGGYSIHRFEASGLNESIAFRNENLGITESDVEFGEASGLRIGANIFRAKFSNYFLTVKGFYQFLREQHSSIHQISSVRYDDEYLLELNHWGVALDIGIPLLGFLDLKVVEGGVVFYNAAFTIESNIDGQNNSEIKYVNTDSEMGYYVGTGLIIHVIPDYISLEGTAIYNFVQIASLDDGGGNIIPYNSVNANFIESGKLAAAVQLNIGFPL